MMDLLKYAEIFQLNVFIYDFRNHYALSISHSNYIYKRKRKNKQTHKERPTLYID